MNTLGRRWWAMVSVFGLAVLTACSESDAATGRGGDRTTTATTTGTSEVEAGRGWLGGEPDWEGGSGGPADEAGAAAPESSYRDEDMAAEGSDRDEAPQSGPPRAGSVDDNDDLDAFLAYLNRLDVRLRDFDATGRGIVTVVGSNGLPVAGAEVVASQDGAELARVRTTADGTARVLPALYGGSATAPIDLAVGGVAGTVDPGGQTVLELAEPGGVNGPVPVDILFLLDATGSMGDEIDQLKVSIDSVSEQIDALESAPDVRFGMTLYRDEGDEFVTANYDFTGDVNEFREALAEVRADGGGDYPEAMEEGLADALTQPEWRNAESTVQLIFLVADAPPQIARDVQVTYPDSIRDAVGRGIKIFPIASSGTDDQAEAVFRQTALATGARFVFLSYGAEGSATGGGSDISPTDYDELALDELVVRLVADELAHLSGDQPGQVEQPTGDPTDQPIDPAPTTNPPGQ